MRRSANRNSADDACSFDKDGKMFSSYGTNAMLTDTTYNITLEIKKGVNYLAKGARDTGKLTD